MRSVLQATGELLKHLNELALSRVTASVLLLDKEYILKFTLVDAKIVEVKSIVHCELLDVILHQHGHAVHKVFRLARCIDQSSNSYLLASIFTSGEVKLNKHLSLVVLILLGLLSVDEFFKMLMFL